MKYLIVVLVYVAVQTICDDTALQFLNKLNSYKPQCMKETNVKPELVEKLFREAEFNEDGDFNCFIKCLLVNMNMMTADGKVRKDEVMLYISPFASKATVDAVIEKCTGFEISDACEAAHNVSRCAVDTFKASQR